MPGLGAEDGGGGWGWRWGSAEVGSPCLTGVEFQSGMVKSFHRWTVVMAVLNATEMYTQKELKW